MSVRNILVILTAMLCIRCGSGVNGDGIYESKEFQAIDSASRSMSIDSLRMFAEALRDKADVYSTADAYADGYMAWAYNVTMQTDSVIKYAEKARLKFLVLGSSISNSALYDLANVELLLGYYNIPISSKTSFFFLNQALSKYKKLDRPTRIIDVYMYMAELCKNEGKVKESLGYLREVEGMCDSLVLSSSNDYSWMLGVLTDISSLSYELGDYRQMDIYLDMASTYYDKSDTESQLYYLLNRARAHLYQKKYTLAAYGAERLERLASSVGDFNAMATAYIYKGLALCRMEIYDQAKECKKKAESLAELYDLSLRKEKLFLDGELAAVDKDFELSYKFLFDSIDTDHRFFEYSVILESRMSYYMQKGDYETLFAVKKEQQSYVDSLQATYIYDHENERLETNKRTLDKLRTEVDVLDKELSRKSRVCIIERVIFAVIILAAIIMIIFHIKNSDRRNKKVIDREYKRLREDNEAKMELVKKQKDMLQVTNKRISESITYAERIQQSILPRPEKLNEYISDAFVFYSPLDVVSGDFYWFTRKGDYLIVCCADCTGHGVPGAFMSMIATTLLKDVCNLAPDDVSPSYILEQLDEKIIEMLGQNQGETGASKDGLDIALVSIELSTKRVRICSARRPVVVIKDQDIISVVGIKRSIGDTEPIFRDRKFVDTEIQLHSGDCIYMYSDGYSDQFGGNDGAKLKNTKVKKFLRAIHDDDMDEQSLTMQELFMQWKGDYPQTDDVLFMGLKM